MRLCRRTTGIAVGRLRAEERAAASARSQRRRAASVAASIGAARSCATAPRAAATARSSACACSAPLRAPPASRWPATDGKTACTSSGTHHRPAGDSAHARAAASSMRPARGDSPRRAPGVAAAAGMCRATPRAAPARSRAAPARRASPAASRCHSASVGGSRKRRRARRCCARRSPPVSSSRSAAAFGIAELDRHQEAVELRFGQRIGADLLDRVLRGDDEERIRQLARLAVLRDLPLLHRLEQRALRLRRRAVDLVGEHDRVEDRARMEAERLRPLVEDRHAEHVGRQEVARELDARVLEAERRRQRLRQRRLADAGDVLDQQVAAREQAGQRERSGSSLPTTMRPSCASDGGEPLRGGDGLAGSGRTVIGGSGSGRTRIVHSSRAAAARHDRRRRALHSARRPAKPSGVVAATAPASVPNFASPVPPPTSPTRRSCCTTWGRITPNAPIGSPPSATA